MPAGVAQVQRIEKAVVHPRVTGQESGCHNCATEILNYAKKRGLRTKVVFINDGPGLLLGSMWDDYAKLENSRPGKILVATLRMVSERITREWLLS